MRPTEQDLQMLKTLLAGGAVALLFMTSHAVADGMPRRAPAASVETPNWTGPYIGVGVGGAFATHDRSAPDVLEDGPVVNAFQLLDDRDHRNHAFVTGTLGYDHQLSGRWVAG